MLTDRMRTTIHIAVLLTLTGCAHDGGNAFVLRNLKTGKDSGPFWFREGSTVTIAGESARIQKVIRANDALVEKLRSRVIPVIEFREADIRDIVTFFREPRVIMSDQEEITDPPIDIVLVLPAGKTPRDMGIPLITWEARSLSIYDALRALAQMTGMEFAIRDEHVWLTKLK
jgi:hypothetical protein